MSTHKDAVEISDHDRDALHVLPLAIVPFDSPVVRRARMIKNARLETVVEIFSNVHTGSGQIRVEDLSRELQDLGSASHRDIGILHRLARLPSYDVYSLRVALRDQDIPVNNFDDLRLSETKNLELASYMKAFTLPLIVEIYGSDDMSIQRFEDIIKLFKDPDIRRAKEKLQMVAVKLGIPLSEVPHFLEDYGDIFLSLSYYKNCLDRILPTTANFLSSLKDIRKNWQLRNDQNLMTTCDVLESTIISLTANIKRLFDDFDKNSRHMWDNISAEKFHEVEDMISGYHTTIGAILCALSVKMDAWHALFPSKSVGGPVKRSEFILSEMKQGIESIRKLRKDATQAHPHADRQWASRV
ncbi:hypothetical protein [Varunaivibrio sulfuroxidans]|uniref:Uncharacterized protein n=1 Tax=Varunaivibrio sulfuroxidans TaxID=1773489 RepID=A0A4R3JFU5_9PROT|nr:hypothetical protein [Varunaivibrio sulfuroxidans]TCS65019.1 hypothetical protein EDD55_101352 [Varunaivibrio sulfuroxidans]WES29691.1 hypothetical protein P3M64_08505 [Varunaivibrio sulfuroxidans]